MKELLIDEMARVGGGEQYCTPMYQGAKWEGVTEDKKFHLITCDYGTGFIYFSPGKGKHTGDCWFDAGEAWMCMINMQDANATTDCLWTA
jgi:hypothetical protein